MKAHWNIAAVVCLFVAAALWVVGYVNGAFVVATLGIVAGFLNQRAQFKVIRDEYEASRLSIEDARDDEVRVEQGAREKIERQ